MDYAVHGLAIPTYQASVTLSTRYLRQDQQRNEGRRFSFGDFVHKQQASFRRATEKLREEEESIGGPTAPGEPHQGRPNPTFRQVKIDSY